MLNPRKAFSSFSVNDIQGAKDFYGKTLGVEVSPGPEGTLPDAPLGPSLFTVISQDLGLRLESKKLPTEVIVIDKAEQPTEN